MCIHEAMSDANAMVGLEEVINWIYGCKNVKFFNYKSLTDVYINIYMDIYTCIHIYMNVYIFVYVIVYKYVCLYAYLSVNVL
jgi:hypothetical protein